MNTSTGATAIATLSPTPSGSGIHAQWLLVQVGGETRATLDSLNGGEVSYKLNREVVLMADQPAI